MDGEASKGFWRMGSFFSLYIGIVLYLFFWIHSEFDKFFCQFYLNEANNKIVDFIANL